MKSLMQILRQLICNNLNKHTYKPYNKLNDKQWSVLETLHNGVKPEFRYLDSNFKAFDLVITVFTYKDEMILNHKEITVFNRPVSLATIALTTSMLNKSTLKDFCEYFDLDYVNVVEEGTTQGTHTHSLRNLITYGRYI